MGNKLHGYTRITLRNPISGNIIKDVESENTFQGGVIAQYLRTLGTNNGIMENAETKANPLWQKNVGGIFLFQNAETVGNMYMSAGNRMIGNGSYGFANAADPPELGTFNNNESSATASAITQVYDFATNQANGQIGCVCLTSQVGGFMGYGNASKKSAGESVRYSWTPSLFQGLEYANPAYAPDGYRYALIGNTQYRFVYDSTNHKITVYKSKVPISKASVFDWIYDSVEIDVSSIYTEMGNSSPRVSCVSGEKIYLMPESDNYIQAGATWKYWVYNPADDSITSKTFTNSTSHRLYTDVFSASHGLLCFKDDSQDYRLDIFNETTGVHIGNYRIADDSVPSGYGWGRDYSLAELPQGLSHCAMMIPRTSQPNFGVYAIYDAVNDTLLPCNGINYGESYSIHPSYYDLEANVMALQTRYGIKKWNHPLYLATINNLNSPVTKTAAQTMKVTYTLTEA